MTPIDYERYRALAVGALRPRPGHDRAVFVLGPVTRGSRRWIELPFFNLQPSQLALVLLTVTLGAFLIDRLELLGTRRITLSALVYVGLPAVLVFLQPDFGTTTVFVALVLALLFFFGTPWTHFAAHRGHRCRGVVALVFGLLAARRRPSGQGLPDGTPARVPRPGLRPGRAPATTSASR